MKKLLLACLALLLALSVQPIPAAERDSKPLNVMTYNLRFDNPSDPVPWAERQKLIAELVGKVDPDVIGTQEGLYHQLTQLESRLPGYRWIGLGREGGSRSEFMAVFYLKKRLEPVAFDHFWLSDTPEVMNSTTWGNQIKRMVTWVQFKDLETGRQFYFVNTHFDHRSQNSRERSAELLRSRIAELKPTLPVIVTGDFNCTSNNPAYKTLTQDGFLKDTWFEAKQRLGEGLDSFNGFKAVQKNNTRIDWILFRGNAAVDRAEIVTWSRDGKFPSDHCPVLTKLTLLE